jgi:tetratricopeptide (TPR) repeat protein
MPRWPWSKKPNPHLDPPADSTVVASTTTGDRSVAAGTVHGGVHIESRTVALAPGAVPPPDDVDAPAAGAQNLPRRPNPVFVGRDALLAEVAALFVPADASAPGTRAAVGQAITGLGGIGKSELALHYAAGRTGQGAVVWWADAENAETLQLALAALAYRLQPKATAEEWTIAQAGTWAIAWLQAHTGWLLVLDNVEDPALITPLLGHLTTGDILITTRRDIDWPDHAVTPVTLDVLPRAASVELLRERLDNAGARPRQGDDPADSAPGFDTHAADALAAELGDLPLALQQAAGYITANRLPLATYLERLRQQTGSMLGKTAPGADPHRAVARVFTLTIDALTHTAPDTVDVLRGLAWLAPVPLPRQVITRPTSSDPQDAGATTGEIDELLGLLASYSLISLTDATVAVHRLLQACLRDHDPPTADDSDPAGPALTRGQATALAWLRAAAPAAPDTNVAGWGLWRELVPHLETLFDQLPDPPELELGRLLNETTAYLVGQGGHGRALTLQKRALAIIEAVLGPDDPDTATTLDNLATTLYGLGRHTEALPLQQRALAITEAALGPDHPDTAIRLANLAVTFGALGRYTEALPLEQRALAVTEAALGPNHPSTAIRLDNLAATFGALGRHTNALPLRQKALAVTEAALGPLHPETAIRLDNLAHTLGQLGRHPEALPLRQRALAITEGALGPDHPDTGTRLNNLGFTLTALGQQTNAIPLHHRALAIAEAALGPTHPSTAQALHNLAYMLAGLGRAADALPLQERALAITEAALGPDHPTTVTVRSNIALTLEALGRPGEAAAVRERIATVTPTSEERGAGLADS